MELDRISSLPSNVTEKILSHLPISVAARTSVLSSKWRYKFAMLPHLVFGCLRRSNIVDHVLLSHVGPISKFQLVQGFIDIGDIDRWVLHLSWYSAQRVHSTNFSLGTAALQDSVVHIFMSRSDSLKVELLFAKTPLDIQRVSEFKSLAFAKITMAQDVLEHLIVCSPLLERLTLSLRDSDGFSQLKIDAPNLQFLDVAGFFEDVSMVNILNVADVSVCFNERGIPWLLAFLAVRSSFLMICLFFRVSKLTGTF